MVPSGIEAMHDWWFCNKCELPHAYKSSAVATYLPWLKCAFIQPTIFLRNYVPNGGVYMLLLFCSVS